MLKQHFHLHRLEQIVTIEKLRGGKAPLFDEALLVLAQSMIRRMNKYPPRHFKERKISHDDELFWRNFQNFAELGVMFFFGFLFLILAIIWFIDWGSGNSRHGFFYADNFFGAHIWGIAFLLCSLILFIGAYFVYKSRMRMHSYLKVTTGAGPYCLEPFGIKTTDLFVDKEGAGAAADAPGSLTADEEVAEGADATATELQYPFETAPPDGELPAGSEGEVPPGFLLVSTGTSQQQPAMTPEDAKTLRRMIEVDYEYDYPPEYYIKADQEEKAAFQQQLLYASLANRRSNPAYTVNSNVAADYSQHYKNL